MRLHTWEHDLTRHVYEVNITTCDKELNEHTCFVFLCALVFMRYGWVYPKCRHGVIYLHEFTLKHVF